MRPAMSTPGVPCPAVFSEDVLRLRDQIWRPGARLKIRHALSGRFVCLPEVATAANNYTLPLSAPFTVHNLAGQLVFMIQDSGELEHPAVLCTAVLTRGNRIAPESYLLSDCATPDGTEAGQSIVVLVLTGTEVHPLDFVEVPLIDLDGVHTPSTPPSSSDSLSPRLIPDFKEA